MMGSYLLGVATPFAAYALFLAFAFIYTAIRAYATNSLDGGGWYRRFQWECDQCKSLCGSRPVASWIPARLVRRAAVWHLRREHVHYPDGA